MAVGERRSSATSRLAQWTRRDLRGEDYPTWRAVFRLLLEVRRPGPVAIVVDEFQYLGDAAAALSGVASELNAQSVAANGARLMLAPRGEVRGLVETALLQEPGLRDIPKY